MMRKHRLSAGVMPAIAEAVLRLYPKVWRERYGEEVADLVASRPVRLRTVADLLTGAADAWLHRRRIPGAQPMRLPLWAILVAASYALWMLWNPAVRDAAALSFSMEQATEVGWLFRAAMTCFAGAGAMALLAPWQLGIAARAAHRRAPYGAAARATGRRVLLTALAVAVPIVLVLLSYLSFGLDTAPPLPALGDAMVGGFFVPTLMTLVLPLPLAAAASPVMASAVRAAGKSLAVAAIMNAIGWTAVAALMASGLWQVSPWFVPAVAASAVLSSGMAALVAGAVLRRSPDDPVALTGHPTLGPTRV
ncbi:hypothetical protein FXF51_36140 [Nonomuraea sp. PA05]|uniref:hypothetical protein n=1 Tax=Nonomuraea sp. PA05 TaxID=2604466 RepID=UPI0011D67358|nr:hypothetical protein [Nonomuraea sp. PA05]TYB58530.1 hypothetical protein FXF51_36140 [Nonomuraea sp. PA05]